MRFDLLPPRREVLKNGLRLIIVETPHLHYSFLAGFVAAGTLYEDNGCYGVSHFVEHLMMSALENRGGDTAANVIPGAVNAHTDLDCIVVWFSTMPERIPQAAERLADVLRLRSFCGDFLESERKLLLNELNLSGDCDGLSSLLTTLFRPKRGSIVQIGNRKIIKRLPRDEINAFAHRALNPNNIVVVLCGPDSERVIESVREELSSLPLSDSTPLVRTALHCRDLPFVGQLFPKVHPASLSMGFVGRAIMDRRDELALQLLNESLSEPGSRLFASVRHGSHNSYYLQTGFFEVGKEFLFVVYGNFETNRHQALAAEVFEELHRIRAGDLPRSWFDYARESRLFHLAGIMDAPSFLAHYFGEYAIRHPDRPAPNLQEDASTLENLGPADVSGALARNWSWDTTFLLHGGAVSWWRKRTELQSLRRIIEKPHQG